MDPGHPFPFISNLTLNLLVTLRHPGASGKHLARSLLIFGCATAFTAQADPVFTKSFAPATIGPGSTSTLTVATTAMALPTIPALALIEVRVLDHIVIGEGEGASFAERGLI